MMELLTEELRPLWEKVQAGERLDFAEGRLLYRTADLAGVGVLADFVRASKHGDSVSFLRNQHLNYSNICTMGCEFCAFSAKADEADAYQHSIAELVSQAQQGVANGACEFHIVGGCHAGLPLSWHLELLEELHTHYPAVCLKAFSAVEIAALAEREGIAIRDLLERLIAAGLQFIPGGGAEIFSDRVRDEICPAKPRWEAWAEVHRTAHELGLRSNATMLYGHLETLDERVDHLLRLRGLQDETGGFHSFVPLAFHPAHTRLAQLPRSSGAGDLRNIAIARLLLDNFAHIKAYWPMLGLKLAQTALSFGADDLDGTITKERISHAAGAKSPFALSVAELKELIVGAGRVPVERNAWHLQLEQEQVEQPKKATFCAKRAPEISPILESVLAGQRLSGSEALALFESHELAAIGAAAEACCQQKHPERKITYIVDRNVNYTNVCNVHCAFCAFHVRAEAKEPGYVLNRETLGRKFTETVELGGTQILLQGGCHPELKLEWYEELLRWAKARFPLQMHCFSPPEIVNFAKLNGLTLAETLKRLIAAGLDSIPGGGAEILSERVRRKISPRKCSVKEWLEVMRLAHGLGLTTSATMMFGHVETLAERIEHLRRLRELQDETGGFIAFIPWTFQAANMPLAGMQQSGGHDYLKTLAISRLYLDNFQHIQASWITQGGRLCQVAVHFGANDVGSVMIEENVVRAAGCAHQMVEEELRSMIRQTGFAPLQRDFYYQPVTRK